MEQRRVDVRDAMVRWFLDLHQSRIGAMQGALEHEPPSAVTVRRSAEATVRMAFEHLGQSYEAPSREALEEVMKSLVEKSIAWGSDRDEVERSLVSLIDILDVESPRVA